MCLFYEDVRKSVGVWSGQKPPGLAGVSLSVTVPDDLIRDERRRSRTRAELREPPSTQQAGVSLGL